MNQPLLIKCAEHILKMDDRRQELRNEDILISNCQILEIGTELTSIWTSSETKCSGMRRDPCFGKHASSSLLNADVGRTGWTERAAV
jgi:hypothetical protein